MNKNKDWVATITINTDASFNHQYKVGGFAFYVVCDHFKIERSGPFKEGVLSAQEAEAKCIGNAIYHLLGKTTLPKCRWIIINTDCLYAMDEIKAGKTTLGKNIRTLLRQLQDRTGARKAKFRHVKAHNGTPDARSWVNDWCDKQAKNCMRELVKSLKSKQ